MRKLSAASLLVAALFAGAACAETLTWSSTGDFMTFDPLGQNESLTNAGNQYVYEPLVRRSDKMQLEPSLATSWKYDAAQGGWIFNIRKGVKFHEGQELTAADCAYSIMRAKHPKSQHRTNVKLVESAKALDKYTLFVKVKSGTPVFINYISSVLMMCEQWCKDHNSYDPQDHNAHEENYAARHTNGTGPFKLVSRKDDAETVFEVYKGWWDTKTAAKSNVTKVIYRPIKSAATRTAALMSGELDFVLDPAPQDLPRIVSSGTTEVVSGPENRSIMIDIDVGHDVVPGLTVDGKPATANPFKDIRVRKAMYQAIDIKAIETKIMRGAAQGSGTVIAPSVHGWSPALEKRLPFDLKAAKKLMKDAGYPNGFAFELKCPNNRYINDEAVCKSLVAMWAKIGLKVSLNAMPRAKYWPAVLPPAWPAANMMGLGSSTFDSFYCMGELVATYDPKGLGLSNSGRIHDPRIDELIEVVGVETDTAKRDKAIAEIWQRTKDNIYILPLYSQKTSWGVRKGIKVAHRADNKLLPQYVFISPEAVAIRKKLGR